jgi:Fe-S-cluster containining protein
MQFVPWRYIAYWRCIECGKCCRLYSVVLDFREWITIIKNYGVGQTVSGLNKLYLRRKSDGSCSFLYNLSGVHLCGLQRTKPIACKLWPFKILDRPRHGYANDATYKYGENTIFVYADSYCDGITYGVPTWEFTNYTLKEFVEIAMGLRSDQYKTTGDIRFL